MTQSSTTSSGIAPTAVDDTSPRLPTRPGERVYKSYFSFMWSGVAFGAATTTYLIGGALPFTGNTLLGIAGYMCGLVVSLIFVVLAGMPSFRYGIDTMDVAKSSLGIRGSSVMLFGVLASSLGWMFVLLAFSARSFGSLMQTVSSSSTINEHYVIGFGLFMLVLVWVIGRRGAVGMEKLSSMVAPGQLICAVILLVLLVYKYGINATLTTNVAPDKAYTTDRVQGLAYAFEFGVANVMTFLPFIGGLTRLVTDRKNVMGPMVVGTGLVSAGFVAIVASFAAVLAGTADPTIWVFSVGGKYFGFAILLFMVLANVSSMVLFIYIAAVASQQIKVFAKIRWSWLIMVLLIPGLYLVFRTEWLLEKVMMLMTYNGLFFVGLLGVILTDYFLLRGQRIEPAHVFTHSHNGAYWFWGGVNWIAILCAALGSAGYLAMYDPVSLKTIHAFRFIGAGMPIVIATMALYYVLMKLLVVRGAKGAYPQGTRISAGKVEVTL